ncbi:hypothetical protein [Hespellia stercorisuis]|uniref:Zinc-finger domain-containing protein n=1 Tax=Hespellia stercorisuis DSM 15480 TaxID=1121950 RepID=A0A1M6WGF9_9FIRM|nr:hypothetical protein [Hespellia stercorisuis]SHK92686.1 hypothetical protein SAMN02745243_04010 [Hespellia stercorisuis DSM 15480]
MMHLNDDQLLNLAEIATAEEEFDDEQIQQLEHLKTCRECYESFCLLSAMSDAMSVSASPLFVPNSEKIMLQESAMKIKRKVLATLNFVRKGSVEAVNDAICQINQAGAFLKFGPSLAMATRGVKTNSEATVRLEEFEDEKTYIVFKQDRNELVIQINLHKIETETVHVYLDFEGGTVIEVPLEKNGKLMRGSIANIPENSFQMRIESGSLEK